MKIVDKIKYKIKKRFRLKQSKLIISDKCEFDTNIFGGHNMIGCGTILQNCCLGSFSYLSFDCRIFRSKIGKYCSVGPRVYAGFSSHPTEKWVTTHPAFYMNLESVIGYSIHTKTEPLYNAYKEVSNGFLSEIGNDVWIGADVKILDGVTIGDGAIIAAGALVTKDVEPYSIVGGVPAKLIRKRFSESQIRFLEEFRWWDKSLEWIRENYLSFEDIDSFIESFGH